MRERNGALDKDIEKTNSSDNSGSQEPQDGQNGGAKENEGPPKPVGFWDTKLNGVRKEVALLWARTGSDNFPLKAEVKTKHPAVLIISTFILCVLSLYWAVLYPLPHNLEALTIAVVSFDGQSAPYAGTTPLVGQAMIEAIEKELKNPMSLGWMIRPASDFNCDEMAVRQAVYDQKFWAAIYVNNNATALLQRAVETGDSSYDPTGAAQVVYNEARDATTVDDYILPYLFQTQIEIVAAFGPQWTQKVLSNSSLDMATYAKVPQALSPAIGFSTFNLRPFFPYVATPAVTIGLIYLIIIAFFSFAFFLPIHMKFVIPKGHPPLHFWQLIVWRYCSTVVAYLLMSLAYSLVSLAFQIPFSHSSQPDTTVAQNANAFGKGSFVVYWMLNFVGMNALGLACENVAMVIGQPWTAFWLIFWVITNVSTSFYAIPTAPRFFFWGYAWPLHSIVEASRTIIFDVKSRLGLDFGILFAWCAVNTTLFPFATMFMRWNTEKGKAKEAGKPAPKYLSMIH